MIEVEAPVSLAMYHRMPIYLKCLKAMQKEGKETVSSVALAEAAYENSSVVKKDLSCVIVNEGKPKVGYRVDELVRDIEDFLGYNNSKDAVLIGVGKLGQALLSYKGFEDQGLNIKAGFDVDYDKIGKVISGKRVLPTGKLESAIAKLNIKMAILAIPQEHAQEMADLLVKFGIRAIWNFSSAHIKVPDNIALKTENMAVSLAVLSKQLKEILEKESE